MEARKSPMSRHNAYRDRKVHLMSEKCDTCIFRPGNLMHLEPGRVKDMVDECLKNDSAVICHKTLAEEDNAVCRGFYDAYEANVTPLRLATAMNIIKEVTYEHHG